MMFIIKNIIKKYIFIPKTLFNTKFSKKDLFFLIIEYQIYNY